MRSMGHGGTNTAHLNCAAFIKAYQLIFSNTFGSQPASNIKLTHNRGIRRTCQLNQIINMI